MTSISVRFPGLTPEQIDKAMPGAREAREKLLDALEVEVLAHLASMGHPLSPSPPILQDGACEHAGKDEAPSPDPGSAAQAKTARGT
jgi:hypothetical protein